MRVPFFRSFSFVLFSIASFLPFFAPKMTISFAAFQMFCLCRLSFGTRRLFGAMLFSSRCRFLFYCLSSLYCLSSRSMPSIFGYGLCSLCSGFSSVVVGSFRFGVSVFFFVGLGGIVCPVLAYAGRMPVSDQWLARASLSYSLTSPGAYGRSSIHGWTRGTVPCSFPSLSVIGSLWVEFCYWVFSFLLFLFSFYFLGVSYVCPMF